MPIGIIVNSGSLVVGGIVGVLIGKYLPTRLVKNLPTIFGLGCILIALTLMIEVKDLTLVILCIIIGAIIGELLNLGDKTKSLVQTVINRDGNLSPDKVTILMTLIMLFMFSGTGIFGALEEGFTGDPSILIAKSALDFFTAIIFGASIGRVVPMIAIPQFVLNIVLFSLAAFIMPFMSETNIADFKAIGGVVALAAALKLLDLIKFDLINLIPCFALSIGLFIII